MVVAFALAALALGVAPLARHSLVWPPDGEPVFDAPGDGTIVTVGNDWKAIFETEGVTFVPFFGSEAPRNYPVRIAPAEVRTGGGLIACETVTLRSRDGPQVSYARGAFVERYVCRRDGLEQVLEINELPARGDVVARWKIESELSATETDAGIRLVSPYGEVLYGLGVAIDGRGRRQPLLPRWRESSIEVTVPADFVLEAELPLTIDPLIEVTSPASGSPVQIAPDSASYIVSFGGARHRFDVWEVVWSAEDHDVLGLHSVLNSGQSTALVIDGSQRYWSHPRATSLGVNKPNQFAFAVVASVGRPAVEPRGICARTLPLPFPGEMQPFRSISAAVEDDHAFPDVGGDPIDDGASRFCAVWQRTRPDGDADVFGQLFDRFGDTTAGPISMSDDPFVHDGRPAISKVNGGTAWFVVWERRVGTNSRDLWARPVLFYGVPLQAFAVADSADDERAPAVASVGFVGGLPRTLVAYERSTLSGSEVQLTRLGLHGALATFDLAAIEGGSAASLDRRLPALDGEQVCAVGYREAEPPSGLFRVRTTLVANALDGAPVALEARLALGLLGAPDAPARVAQEDGNPSPRFYLIWDQPDPTGGSDVWSAVLDSVGGPGSVVAICAAEDAAGGCPCGVNGPAGCSNSLSGTGAELGWSGRARVSADRFQVRATNLPPGAPALLVQANEARSANAFGDGLSCVAGTLTVIAVRTANAAGEVLYPDAAADQPIAVLGAVPASGGRRVYQLWYRDFAPFCTDDPRNATNALAVHWAP